jgi:uracil-DNA glycosylase
MVERQERELVLGSVKAYLEELWESGVDELEFAELPAVHPGEPRSPQHAEKVAPQVPEERQASEERQEGAPQAKGPAERPVPEHPCQAAGNPKGRMVMVMKGEGFAGAAGELLGKIIQAMGFATSDVCLLSFAEIAPTRETLLRQIRDVGPELVVALGEETAQLLLQSGAGIAKLRGRFHDLGGVPLMPTLHPEAMLADPGLKRQVWSEMQQVMRRLAQPSLSH